MTSTTHVAIIYTSIHHGNTRKLAETFAGEFGADLLTVEEAGATSLAGYGLLGLGSGIYCGRHDWRLRQFVESWATSPRRVFIFSTAGLSFLHRLQHSSLRRKLVRKGCTVVSEFSCRGWDTVGPLWLMGGINRHHPNVRDLNRAKEFAKRLKAESFSICDT